jgi:SM-20-related protein
LIKRLSGHWCPDWDGQLLFHDDKGDVRLGLMPRFNTLSSFKVADGARYAKAGARPLQVGFWINRARRGVIKRLLDA